MNSKVKIELTDDNYGLYSIFEEDDNLLETDFESYEEAEEWAISNGYEVVTSQ